MKRLVRSIRWSCGIFVFGLAMPLLQAQVKKDRVVVVISLDGFPAYALKDERLPIPTLRKLAREGVVAESMKPVNPSVTWPNHTAIVTGVDASANGVLLNGLLTHGQEGSPPKVEMWRDKDVLVHSPTIYDIAHEAGLSTAQVDWVAIYNAKTIDWQFAEIPDPKGEIEQSLIHDGIVTSEQLKTFEDSSQAWQDEIWTDAAVKILTEHHPNLLLLHLLTLDNINHEYQPMSQASFTAMAYLDSQVNRIVRVLQQPDFVKRSTLIIVSDHGFRKFQHTIHANNLLREKNIVTSKDGTSSADAWVVPEGGIAMVYVRNFERKPEMVARLTSLFREAEGIERVYGAGEFGNLGLPTPNESDQAPDLVLAAKTGYAFSSAPDNGIVSNAEGGTHGYLNSDPQMQAIFLAWGEGIPKGIQLGRISNLDAAPTIAKLLGVELKTARSNAIPGLEK